MVALARTQGIAMGESRQAVIIKSDPDQSSLTTNKGMTFTEDNVHAWRKAHIQAATV